MAQNLKKFSRPRGRKKKASTEVLTPELVDTKTESTALTIADPLSLYLAEVRKYPLLTPEEEKMWAKKYYDEKDPAAAEKLVTSNLRFVVKIASEYSRFGARMIDLVQEGNVGLMHAVKEFNPYKGVKLITYAVWWIRGFIQEYLMKQYSMVRVGTTQNQRKLFYQLQKERQKLESLGREAGIALLSTRLGIPEDEVKSMDRRMNNRDVSLDQPLDNESKSTLLDAQSRNDAIGADVEMERQEQFHILHDKIEAVRPKLSEKEVYILDNRILADPPLTLQEIGDKYGITRERARQLEVRVMEKIKESYEPGQS